MKKLCLVFTLLFSVAYADVGGKNVILIHGFNPFHLINNPTDNGKKDADNYWNGINSEFLKSSGASNIIHWPSHKRLVGSGGIISIVKPQIDQLLNENYCANKCVIVTHSTGDLVARYLLKNKNSIFGGDASKFKVAAVIDLAGAGGGTELANYGVGIANGVNFAGSVISGLLDFAGFNISLGLDVGVLNDLQTSVARNHATNGFPSIPHLRVAGTGDELYGFATHPLIKGSDDSVVPLHSACGAIYASSYKSCSRDTRVDGKVTFVSKAPRTSELYDFHYPIVMSETLAHNVMQTGATGNNMTSVRSLESLYKQESNSISVNIDDFEKREWWDFFTKYRYIRDAKNHSVTTVIVEKIVR